MLVAVVKELKQGEGRVVCTPENVYVNGRT